MKTKHIICILFLTTLLISCGSSKTTINPDDKLVGNWNIVAENTPQGDVDITMTIHKNEEGEFEGSFKSVMGEYNMINLVLKNGVIACDFDVQGTLFGFKGVFTNDDFKGQTIGPGQVYVTNGKRMEN